MLNSVLVCIHHYPHHRYRTEVLSCDEQHQVNLGAISPSRYRRLRLHASTSVSSLLPSYTHSQVFVSGHTRHSVTGADSPARDLPRGQTMEDGSLYRNRRFNAVGFCLTGIRIWQWTASFFVYASFSLLYAHVHKNRLGDNGRMKAVQVLVRTILPQALLIVPVSFLYGFLGCH